MIYESHDALKQVDKKILSVILGHIPGPPSIANDYKFVRKLSKVSKSANMLDTDRIFASTLHQQEKTCGYGFAIFPILP
jgi:hypothetical protein